MRGWNFTDWFCIYFICCIFLFCKQHWVWPVRSQKGTVELNKKLTELSAKDPNWFRNLHCSLNYWIGKLLFSASLLNKANRPMRQLHKYSHTHPQTKQNLNSLYTATERFYTGNAHVRIYCILPLVCQGCKSIVLLFNCSAEEDPLFILSIRVCPDCLLMRFIVSGSYSWLWLFPIDYHHIDWAPVFFL